MFQIFILILTITNMSVAIIEYKNWAFHFPANSNMGIFIALAIPIEDPNENVFLAYNIEANYLLPGNESETVQYPPLVTEEQTRNNKNIDRNKIYKVIEAKLKTFDYPGKECLLRLICEVSSSYFAHNGILGDLMHILFTPSSSVNVNLPVAYINAEEYGKTKKHCKRYEKKCIKSFYDLITWIGRA